MSRFEKEMQMARWKSELHSIGIERDMAVHKIEDQKKKINEMIRKNASEDVLVTEAKELMALENQLKMVQNKYERRQLIINQKIAAQQMEEIIRSTAEGQALAQEMKDNKEVYQKKLVQDRINNEDFKRAENNFHQNMGNDPQGNRDAAQVIVEMKKALNYPAPPEGHN